MRELGVDLDDERLAPRAGRPVIVARSVGITTGEVSLRPGDRGEQR